MNERETLNEIFLVKTEKGHKSNQGNPLRNRLVYLSVEENADLNQIMATAIITKPLDSPPIRRDSVSIVLQDLNDQLYIPLDQNEEGYLPETRLRSATASEIFKFGGKISSMKRAIVFLEGNITSFKFPASVS